MYIVQCLRTAAPLCDLFLLLFDFFFHFELDGRTQSALLLRGNQVIYLPNKNGDHSGFLSRLLEHGTYFLEESLTGGVLACLAGRTSAALKVTCLSKRWVSVALSLNVPLDKYL